MLTRRGAMLLALLALGSSAAAADDRLAEAHQLDQENYEMAIKAAQAAQSEPGASNEAKLVLARANLEQYRQTHDAANLTAARESLRTLDATKLSSRSRSEFTVGLGEWLFLDDRYGAAAELFDAGVASADVLGPAGRDRILDWWATAVDRHAQVTPAHRLELYQRIVDRMESELRTRPGSVAAGYWLPAAARSLGDLDRAWQAAIAGWLRARVAPDRGETLRADLDRLVESAIIPERARELTMTGGNAKDAVAVMTAEWEHLKTSWN